MLWLRRDQGKDVFWISSSHGDSEEQQAYNGGWPCRTSSLFGKVAYSHLWTPHLLCKRPGAFFGMGMSAFEPHHSKHSPGSLCDNRGSDSDTNDQVPCLASLFNTCSAFQRSLQEEGWGYVLGHHKALAHWVPGERCKGSIVLTAQGLRQMSSGLPQ